MQNSFKSVTGTLPGPLILFAQRLTSSSPTGTFVVPTPKTPTGGSSSTTYYASAWVGIDGDTFQNSILQTGIDFAVRGSSVSYDGMLPGPM